MKNFEKWDKKFRDQDLFSFNGNENAILWLKARAISRKELLIQFCENNNIKLTSTKIAQQKVELFAQLEKKPDSMNMLNRFLRDKNNELYNKKGIDKNALKEDLYKVQHYEWGGDRNNSLDKHLVSRYVKVISKYDELCKKQQEIADNAWHYIQNSWYNNWTSYLIESLFKDHTKVISAVGEIKSVDFFIGNNPIDLKVTFFPKEYMDLKLEEKLGKRELPWLKSKAKEINVTVGKDLTPTLQVYSLTEQIKDHGEAGILDELKEYKKQVIDDVQKKPEDLMKWLYTKQGEMRFGAENRIFVILVDFSNMNDSWKMKRNFNLIEEKVQAYLDGFNDNSLKRIMAISNYL